MKREGLEENGSEFIRWERGSERGREREGERGREREREREREVKS